MKTTKWVTVALPIEDHKVLAAEAHRLSIAIDGADVTFADVVKDALHEKAERIRSGKATQS